MDLADFDFELPEDRIALRPVSRADPQSSCSARPMLWRDHRVEDLPSLLRAGDLLVFNDTKVIPARLRGERRRETPHGDGVAKIEALLTERLDSARWRALAKPGKRLSIGDRIDFSGLTAELVAKHAGGSVEILFDRGGAALEQAIAERGEPPLPPYIAGRRAADRRDHVDYQTVFAREDGAVAAPTAALHLRRDFVKGARRRGMRRDFRDAACGRRHVLAGQRRGSRIGQAA